MTRLSHKSVWGVKPQPTSIGVEKLAVYIFLKAHQGTHLKSEGDVQGFTRCNEKDNEFHSNQTNITTITTWNGSGGRTQFSWTVTDHKDNPARLALARRLAF